MSHFAKDHLNRAAAELTAAERQEKPPSRAVRTDAYGYNGSLAPLLAPENRQVHPVHVHAVLQF